MEVFNINKSFLAPQADKLATQQLSFLVLNMPFTVILNSYKSKLVDLDSLRVSVENHNGFAYHPNKNVKSRAFKRFRMVLSPDMLDGLVVFAFFRNYNDTKNFLNMVENKLGFGTISYYATLIDGHISDLSLMNNSSMINAKHYTTVNAFRLCNETLFNATKVYNYSLNKIYLILNAYTKSIN